MPALTEVMVPQHHPFGDEAEVDFGLTTVISAGVLDRAAAVLDAPVGLGEGLRAR